MRTVIAVSTAILGMASAISIAEAGHGGFGGGHLGGFGGGHFGAPHFGGAHFAARSFAGGWHGSRISGGDRYYGRVGARVNHSAPFARNTMSGRGQFVAHNQLRSGQFAHGQQLSMFRSTERFPSNFNQLGHGQFAHAQLSALPNSERFHGLNHFNPNGFNRNAFGKEVAWNHWGRNHWGAGWNHWGRGWGFWSGPVFWPFFWGDFLTSWLWPYAYYDPFWYYGSDCILASVFWPGPIYGPNYAWPYGYAGLYDIYGYGDYTGHVADDGYDYGYSVGHPDTAARETTAQAAPAEQGLSTAKLGETCGGLAPGVTDLPVDRIEDAVHPTGDQIAALDNLKSAASKAADVLKASCPGEAPLTPVSRLDAMEKRFGSLVQAVEIVRTPLESFYNSLTDQQRQRFDAIGGSTSEAGHSNGLASLCSQESERFTQLPLQRIDRTIQPTQEQQHALDNLKTASSKAANELQASCPTEGLHMRGDRLEAMNKRLHAMIEAVETVRPSLAAFYASLSDEQKARFNIIGQPRDQSASQAGGRAD